MLTQSTCTITVLFLTNSVLLCTDTLYLYNLQYCLPVLSTESVISRFYEISYSLATYISEVRPGICSLKPNPLFFSSVERLTSPLFPSWSDLFGAPRLTLSSHRMAGKGSRGTWKKIATRLEFSGCLGLACCPDRFYFFNFFFKHERIDESYLNRKTLEIDNFRVRSQTFYCSFRLFYQHLPIELFMTVP